MPVHLDQAVVEQNERVLLKVVLNSVFPVDIEQDSRLSEPDSKVQVSVYASFELGPIFGHRELLLTSSSLLDNCWITVKS
jgi:hypothetical protein